jgi:hypothetical protein
MQATRMLRTFRSCRDRVRRVDGSGMHRREIPGGRVCWAQTGGVKARSLNLPQKENDSNQDGYHLQRLVCRK